MVTILEEHGLFWWHDEPLSDRQLAPEAHVAGLCTIENNGRITLELDGYLPGPHGPMAAMSGPMPTNKCTQGILKGAGQRILFIDLIRSGGRFSTNSLSFENFVAMQCLIGSDPFPNQTEALTFDALAVPLEGYEEWLRLGSIDVSRSEDKVSVIYEKPNNIVFAVAGGTLSIEYDAKENASGFFRSYELSLKQTASIKFRLTGGLKLDGLISQYGLLEDLLKLLTGSDYHLDWPSVSLGDKATYRWYGFRHRSEETIAAPRHYNTVTNFLQLRDKFGAIWSRWIAKREEFGPGIYLYLGTRRGVTLYAEHRFVNLIWGIEAFHRKKYVAAKSAALSAKIKRIVEQVGGAKDKSWLRNKLKNAHEPPLDQRIFDVLKTLPLDLEETRLHLFSKACAKARNDISHFGGLRHASPYAEFIRDLEQKSTALSTLYHALLLHELEIDASILKHWIYEGFNSYPIKRHFVDAGLLDESVLTPAALPTNPRPA